MYTKVKKDKRVKIKFGHNAVIKKKIIYSCDCKEGRKIFFNDGTSQIFFI